MLRGAGALQFWTIPIHTFLNDAEIEQRIMNFCHY